MTQELLWEHAIKLSILPTITVEEVQNFIPLVLNPEVHLETIVGGNLSQEEALNLVDIVEGNLFQFGVRPGPQEAEFGFDGEVGPRTVLLPEPFGNWIFNKTHPNDMEPNSAVDF